MKDNGDYWNEFTREYVKAYCEAIDDALRCYPLVSEMQKPQSAITFEEKATKDLVNNQIIVIIDEEPKPPNFDPQITQTLKDIQKPVDFPQDMVPPSASTTVETNKSALNVVYAIVEKVGKIIKSSAGAVKGVTIDIGKKTKSVFVEWFVNKFLTAEFLLENIPYLREVLVAAKFYLGIK